MTNKPNQKEPREFGLYYNYHGESTWEHIEKHHRDIQLGACDIHAVEYSAYDKLKAEVETSHPSNFKQYKKDQETIKKLQAENEKLVGALKFYADKFNWRSNSGKIGITPLTDGTDSKLIDGHFTNGELARQTLKETGHEGE